MAKVILVRDKAEKGALPPYCMRCGAAAVIYREKTFAWLPEAMAGPGPPITEVRMATYLWGVITADRIETKLPFCARHRGRFGTTFWTAFFIAWFCAVGVLASLGYGSAALVLGIALPIVAVIAFAWRREMDIKVREITDVSLVLTGVSPEFVKRLVTEGYAEPVTEPAQQAVDKTNDFGLRRYPD